ncbi:MAG: acyl carrier protein [Bacteroidales bacterium]|nr:acyl carrier protein [Bacteroidales bacterium]
MFKQVFDTEVNEQSSQQDIEKWDSLGHLNLIVALEEEFDVLFEPEEIAEMTSVQKIISKIEAHLK